MGANNLYRNRRKTGGRASLHRQSKRATFPKILIVCEGEKTEPNYFNGLRDKLRLNSANVKITGKGASNPMGVVSLAGKRYKEHKDAGFPFDRVFCVFDRNNHGDYDEALNKIKKMRGREDVFHAKVSVPSFEYYLLLHYEYTTSPCTSAQALSRLKKRIRGYTKGKKDIFAVVYDKLETAKIDARKSLTAARKSGSDNPLTEAHELVEFMQGMVQD